jgi:lipopolysaccharide transport system ATP-binding protein
MGATAIRLEGIGKLYRLGEVPRPYQTLRQSLSDAALEGFTRVKSLFNGQKPAYGTRPGSFWALKDVSLEVKHGEIVGIIGRNGAGKTTLLKILSRITDPTEGYGEIHGRVGSLLEVGTGFHPELTGRENIYLNGAILGMRKREIDRKFDEIVSFSEVEKFLDTPVKHYSSGMQVRLAFAVAAHLDPEILLVDEVLAVGDARFQKKCLNKMEDVTQQGRTILFVSHNMPAVTRLCSRAILLDEGRVIQDGPAHRVVNAYLWPAIGTPAAREWEDPAKAPAGDVARLRAVRIRAEDGRVAEVLDVRRPVAVEMEYEVTEPGHELMGSYDFVNEEGIIMFTSLEQDPAWRGRRRPVGRYVSTAWIPGNLLAEGMVFVHVFLLSLNPSPRFQFKALDAVSFRVVDTLEGDSSRGDFAGPVTGVVRPFLKWTTQFSPRG